MVLISHQGPPCIPAVVDGVEFRPLGEDDLWIAECTEEQAQHFTRIPAFVRYGGAKKPVQDAEGAVAPAEGEEAAPAPKKRQKKG